MTTPTTIRIPEEIRAKLRQSLAEGAVKQHPTKSYMSSINGAFITERLDDCFGENGWDADYTIIENSLGQKMVVVKCVLQVPEFGIKRTTFGGNDNPDRGDAYKGACTDALGKACSQIGIARDIYKGLHDGPPAEDNQAAAGQRKQRQPKRQYENVDGVVTKYEFLAPDSLWLQINGNRFRATDKYVIQKLKDSMGKKVEVTCYWDAYGKNKTPVMTISSVVGVYSPIPGDTQYVKDGFAQEPEGRAEDYGVQIKF